MKHSKEDIQEEIESLTKVLRALRRRRFVLDEQAASEGIQARPNILIELKELEQQIIARQNDIAHLEVLLETTSPPPKDLTDSPTERYTRRNPRQPSEPIGNPATRRSSGSAISRRVGILLILVSTPIVVGLWFLLGRIGEGTPPPPCAAGLVCDIFQQVGDGQVWEFQNHGGLLSTNVADPTCSHSGQSGIRLIYDMTKGAQDANGGWGVHWRTALVNRLNAVNSKNIVFWVKGAKGGEAFQLGLKDTTGNEVNLESAKWITVSTTWNLVVVPLKMYVGQGVNTRSIENLHFGFNLTHGSGSICLDEIAFVP